MDKSHLEHGQGADIKSSRPENQAPRENLHAKTKIPMAPNKHEGPRDEPSHSGHREDS